MSLVIVGSVALDTIETPHGKVEDALGGSAVYASLAASYFGPTYIVGVVGEDYPARGVELLEAHKVNLDGLETKPGKTFRWSGAYRQWSQADTLSTDLNVFADFSPQLPPSCRSCRSLLLANIHPQLQLQVLNQIESYKWAACDTMNYWISLCPELLSEVIRKVDIVFINEDEIRQYTGLDSIFAAGRYLLEMGVKAVVIKRGEYGSVTILPDDLFFAPAYPVERIQDPTGAGDSFAGGFMSYLATQDELNKYVIRKAVRFGTVLAAKNVSALSVDGLVNLEFSELQQKVHQLRNWA
ncbi:MAG TPA: PfkB family carbohydrate kinase [Candidatus Syntrophosphaera sp.]|jgi:sugar/nucleoside kinase (ribokinase family)|nr:PfkB family carbohydrate kinase [Candidatus Syntrophosphaera sp.]HOH47990.1 PfkB family carbohydrate kinase [Candidatus Syntrophosphaera sp.]HOR02471.1 PfkB family carbohydrate kinase [Candidatus Syntrophosphaera sp.]HPK83235.1 PfkB family carbohydrate kinase [Candidatus Syntrophosphaera sp.]HPW38837.1 PfkB family carbohydrate kinase [Candidatus Syntrophosphaera sp.]